MLELNLLLSEYKENKKKFNQNPLRLWQILSKIIDAIYNESNAEIKIGILILKNSLPTLLICNNESLIDVAQKVSPN